MPPPSSSPSPSGEPPRTDGPPSPWAPPSSSAQPSPWAPPHPSAQPPRPPGPGHQGWDRPPQWSRPPTGPVRAPSGSRYDEQGRNGQGGRFGWLGELSVVVAMVLVSILVISLAGLVIAELLDAGPTSADSDLFFEDPVADLAVQLLGIAVGIPIVLGAARLLGRRPAGTVSSVVGRLRWGWLWRCAAVAFPLMIVQIGLLIAWTWNDEPLGETGSGFPGWPVFLLSLAVVLALVPFQAAAEEYVFRGWLVQVIGRTVRSPWPAIVLASLLFALAHGFGEWSGFLLLLYSALWWGWLVIRTGGLEAVIVMHVANNLLAFGLAAGFGELASTETAADAPWQAMVVELVFAPLYCLTMARIAGRRGVERVSP
ncbi:CPBP family intramembrane glutamic endopeptidase [Streptomyces sp. NPDC058576]|uniref:CPBP family intramembrane glutamic endopeptidase n=1 Tax=Streptomyces sp. NPDC058576 TaxID=3346547 RepID=UPI00364F24FC